MKKFLILACFALAFTGCAEATKSLSNSLKNMSASKKSLCDRPLEQISIEKEAAAYAEALEKKINSEPLESAPPIKTISYCQSLGTGNEILISKPSFSAKDCASRSIMVEIKINKLETSRDWKLWYEFSKFGAKARDTHNTKIYRQGSFSFANSTENKIALTSKDWKEFRERKIKQCVQRYKKLNSLQRAEVLYPLIMPDR